MIGTGASAIQFVPQIQPRGRRAAPLPAHAAVGHAAPRPPDHARASGALYRALARAPSGSMRARHLLGARELRRSASRHPRADALAAARSARRHLRRQVRDPELRAQAHARATRIGCKRDPDLQRLLPGARRSRTSSVVTDGIAEVRERSIVDRRRHRARGRHDHLRHRLPRHRHADRRARPRPRRAHAGRGLGRQPAGPPAARRSPASRTSSSRRPQHRPRAQLDRLHDRVAVATTSLDALRHDGRARRRRASRSGPRLRRPTTRASRRRCAARCGTRAAARAGTSTPTGRNTTLWPTFTWAFARARAGSTPHYARAPRTPRDAVRSCARRGTRRRRRAGAAALGTPRGTRHRAHTRAPTYRRCYTDVTVAMIDPEPARRGAPRDRALGLARGHARAHRDRGRRLAHDPAPPRGHARRPAGRARPSASRTSTGRACGRR